MFALKIIHLDYYLANPIKNIDLLFNPFDSTEIKKVPVLRIFGSTPKNQSVCCHVHGIFPFFYILLDDVTLKEKLESEQNAIKSNLLQKIAEQINQTVNASFGNANSTQTHVFKIILVSGKPFYGFYENSQLFLKIFLFNPSLIPRVADFILNSKIIFGKSFQPHETHIPFNLQFLIDFNLYGMNFMFCEAAKFRTTNSERFEILSNSCNQRNVATINNDADEMTPIWNTQTINKKHLLFTGDKFISKLSKCELEVDVNACDILNASELDGHPIKNENEANETGFDLENRQSQQTAATKTPLVAFNPGLRLLWEAEQVRRDCDLDQGNPDQKLRANYIDDLADRPFASITDQETSLLAQWKSLLENKQSLAQSKDVVNRVNPIVISSSDSEETVKEHQNENAKEGEAQELDEEKEEEKQRDANSSAMINSPGRRTRKNARLQPLSSTPILSSKKNATRMQIENRESDDDAKSASTPLEEQKAESEIAIKKNGRERKTAGRNASPPAAEHSIDLFADDDDNANDAANKHDNDENDNHDDEDDEHSSSSDYDVCVIPQLDGGGGGLMGARGLTKRGQKSRPNYVTAAVASSRQEQQQPEEQSPDKSSSSSNKRGRVKRSGGGSRMGTHAIKQKLLRDSSPPPTCDPSPLLRLPLTLQTKYPIGREVVRIKDVMLHSGNVASHVASERETRRPICLRGEEILLMQPHDIEALQRDARFLAGQIGRCERVPALSTNCQKQQQQQSVASSHTLHETQSQTQLLLDSTTANSDDFYQLVADLDEKSQFLRHHHLAVSHSQSQSQTKCEPSPSIFESSFGREWLDMFDAQCCASSQKSVGLQTSQTVDKEDVVLRILREYNPGIGGYSSLMTQSPEVTQEISGDQITEKQKEEEEKEQSENDKKDERDDDLEISDSFHENLRDASINSTILRGATQMTQHQRAVECKKNNNDNATMDAATVTQQQQQQQRMLRLRRLQHSMSLAAPPSITSSLSSSQRITQRITQRTTQRSQSNAFKHADQSQHVISSPPHSPPIPVVQNELAVLNLELHVELTNPAGSVGEAGNRGANPCLDEVRAAFYAFAPRGANCADEEAHLAHVITQGCIIVIVSDDVNSDDATETMRRRQRNQELICQEFDRHHRGEVCFVRSELELFDTLLETIDRFDPDVLLGFEVEKSSWGYLIRRAASAPHLQRAFAPSSASFASRMSRLITLKDQNQLDEKEIEEDEKGKEKKGKEKKKKAGEGFCDTKSHPTSKFANTKCAGRIIVSLWRLLKHELSLHVYSLENCVHHVLNERMPHYSACRLSMWLSCVTSDFGLYSAALSHYTQRSAAPLRILARLRLFTRYSEFARVYGIEFEHVFSRGSQYRVESMMLRLAKPAGLVPPSPTARQRATQPYPQVIPLTLEPQPAGFYADPVAVLDFQSHYPSTVIAYNYCYSTVIGRVVEGGNNNSMCSNSNGGSNSLGCLEFPKLSAKFLQTHADNVNIAPNGLVFLKSHVQKGILPRLVEEILNTRFMVKNSMKLAGLDPQFKETLNHRQLGLKLIANVTYGYVGANFSGRMPCVQIADSIVGKARELLENAMNMVNNSQEAEWAGCRVVYGDTDSMFVVMPGRSRAEAFRIGQQISAQVTALCPYPVKLQLERVFQRCILDTRKRYAGVFWENATGSAPAEFLAKGIETVRRDAPPLSSELLERTLRWIFRFDKPNREDLRAFVCRHLSRSLMETRIDTLPRFLMTREFHAARHYQNLQSYHHHRDRHGNVEGGAALGGAASSKDRDEDEEEGGLASTLPANVIARQVCGGGGMESGDAAAAFGQPVSGTRLRFLVGAGLREQPVHELVRDPERLLLSCCQEHHAVDRTIGQCQPGMIPRPNIDYYAQRAVLPTLHRILRHLDCDVFAWYRSMGKHKNFRYIRVEEKENSSSSSSHSAKSTANQKRVKQGPPNLNKTLSSFFKLNHCLVCDRQTDCGVTFAAPHSANNGDASNGDEELRRLLHGEKLCSECESRPIAWKLLALRKKFNEEDARRADLEAVCASCSGLRGVSSPFGPTHPCVSLDCPVFFQRLHYRKAQQFRVTASSPQSVEAEADGKEQDGTKRAGKRVKCADLDF